MGYALFGMATLLFLAGVAAQLAFGALFGPGAGADGASDNAALQAAEAVAVYASACLATASASPGMLGTVEVVMQPTAGAFAVPAGASCVTTAAPGGGRYCFASAKSRPGMAGALAEASQGSMLWHQVLQPGQAVSLASGGRASVPTSIPGGSVLNWTKLDS